MSARTNLCYLPLLLVASLFLPVAVQADSLWGQGSSPPPARDPIPPRSRYLPTPGQPGGSVARPVSVEQITGKSYRWWHGLQENIRQVQNARNHHINVAKQQRHPGPRMEHYGKAKRYWHLKKAMEARLPWQSWILTNWNKRTWLCYDLGPTRSTRPFAANFDAMLRHVQGNWRLIGRHVYFRSR